MPVPPQDKWLPIGTPLYDIETGERHNKGLGIILKSFVRENMYKQEVLYYSVYWYSKDFWSNDVVHETAVNMKKKLDKLARAK